MKPNNINYNITKHKSVLSQCTFIH